MFYYNKINVFVCLVFLVGCNDLPSPEYKKFVETYNSNKRLYCDGTFLMEETFISIKSTKPRIRLINSNICETETNVPLKTW